MYVLGLHACNAFIAIAPKNLRYQVVYSDSSLKVCRVDLDSRASAVMVHYQCLQTLAKAIRTFLH